VHNISVTQA